MGHIHILSVVSSPHVFQDFGFTPAAPGHYVLRKTHQEPHDVHRTKGPQCGHDLPGFSPRGITGPFARVNICLLHNALLGGPLLTTCDIRPGYNFPRGLPTPAILGPKPFPGPGTAFQWISFSEPLYDPGPRPNVEQPNCPREFSPPRSSFSSRGVPEYCPTRCRSGLHREIPRGKDAVKSLMVIRPLAGKYQWCPHRGFFTPLVH